MALVSTFKNKRIRVAAVKRNSRKTPFTLNSLTPVSTSFASVDMNLLLTKIKPNVGWVLLYIKKLESGWLSYSTN